MFPSPFNQSWNTDILTNPIYLQVMGKHVTCVPVTSTCIRVLNVDLSPGGWGGALKFEIDGSAAVILKRWTLGTERAAENWDLENWKIAVFDPQKRNFRRGTP